jgi:hypothetical protein
LLTLALVPALRGQEQLRVTRALPTVWVVVELRSASPAVVATCGESEFGTRLLCLSNAYLEVLTRDGWRRAELRKTFAVLGGPSADRIHPAAIAPNETGQFIFNFSRRHFEVETGQQLRLAVDTWPSEEALRSNSAATRLTSPSFKCPLSGIGSFDEEQAMHPNQKHRGKTGAH